MIDLNNLYMMPFKSPKSVVPYINIIDSAIIGLGILNVATLPSRSVVLLFHSTASDNKILVYTGHLNRRATF